MGDGFSIFWLVNDLRIWVKMGNRRILAANDLGKDGTIV